MLQFPLSSREIAQIEEQICSVSSDADGVSSLIQALVRDACDDPLAITATTATILDHTSGSSSSSHLPITSSKKLHSDKENDDLNIAQTLGIDPNSSFIMFQCAKNDQRWRQTNKQLEQIQHERMSKSLDRKMASLLKTHDMIKDVCSVRLNAPSSVEGGNASHHDHHDIETLKQTIEMLQLKGQEYEEKLDHLKTTWEEQYSHVRVDDLLKLEQDVQRLAVQVEEKERRLRSFADLDPDINLSRLKLQERRAELDALVNTKNDLLSLLAQGMS